MRKNLIPVKDQVGMVRDPNSQAILYINNNETVAARARKQERRDKEMRQLELEKRMDSIESKLNTILEKL